MRIGISDNLTRGIFISDQWPISDRID